MASIIAKLQRCGKTNCHCYASGSFHGPYFWLVSYVRSEHGKGKYRWKYLGKDPQSIYIKLKDLGVPNNFSRIRSQRTFNHRLRRGRRRVDDHQSPPSGICPESGTG